MKALSLRQPWADLVVQGKKTLELRSWTVKYRGPLAIHASQTVDRDACLAHGMNHDQVTAGAIIGIVDLVDIAELDAKAFVARRNEHLADERFSTTPLYGWQLANSRALPQPRPMHGRMGLFNVQDEWLAAGDAQIPEPEPAAPVFEPTWNPERPFELRVVPEPKKTNHHSAYNVALYQRFVKSSGTQRTLYCEQPATPTARDLLPEMQRVVEIGGSVLRTVSDNVMDALRRSGYKATDLSASRREPFLLSEESGVRLGLLFLTVKPITKVTRVEAIAHGLRAMTSEETYYWYSKCTTKRTADRAQKALRVLLAEA